MTTRATARLQLINFVSTPTAPPLLGALAAADYQVINLDGGTITDKSSLMTQAALDMPGFDVSRPQGWSGFEDAITTMLFALEARSVALVWHQAHRMLEGGLTDLITAIDIFTVQGRRIRGQRISFSAIFVGNGPNFPAWR